MVNTLLSVVVALGAFSLLLVTARGNSLILAAPASLWGFVIFLTLGREGNKKCMASLPTKIQMNPLFGQKLLTGKALIAVAIWIVTLTIWLPRVSSGFISDSRISEVMAEARAYFEKGQLDQAIITYETIVIPKHHSGRNAEKYFNLGIAFMGVGDPEKACSALHEAIVYDPKNAEAYYLLACITYELGRYTDTSHYLEVLRGLNPHRKGIGDLEKALNEELSENVPLSRQTQ